MQLLFVVLHKKRKKKREREKKRTSSWLINQFTKSQHPLSVTPCSYPGNSLRTEKTSPSSRNFCPSRAGDGTWTNGIATSVVCQWQVPGEEIKRERGAAQRQGCQMSLETMWHRAVREKCVGRVDSWFRLVFRDLGVENPGRLPSPSCSKENHTDLPCT